MGEGRKGRTLLTESFEPDNIPLISDVVFPGTSP
ncbi:DNA polymerase III subunit chi, partial [Pseudomonas aeruginosa]